MRRRIVVFMVGAGMCAAASAQFPGEDSAPSGDELDAPPAASELDILSRAPDDPFAAFEEEVMRRPISVTVRALDKITARYTDIETDIGVPATFGSLEILPHYCDKRPPEDFPETTGFFEIFDRDLSRARASATVEAKPIGERPEAEAAPAAEEAQPTEESSRAAALDDILGDRPADPDRIFSGWMFASSPALNALEHPVYDVWVIDCKTEVVDE